MIDLETLLVDLENCRRVAPVAVTQMMVDRQLKKLATASRASLSDLAPTQALAQLVSRNLRLFVSEEARDALAACNVYVVALPLCSAYSKPPNSIVIGSGLIDSLVAYGFWVTVADRLPDQLNSVFIDAFPKTSAKDLIPVLLIALLFRYVYFGDPLPNYRAMLGDPMDEQVRHAVAGAMTFVLLHELGHLQLQHFDNRQSSVRLMDMPFMIAENLSDHQQQEYEADDHAKRSILDAYEPLHRLWMGMALGPHLLFETLLSRRNTGHPICINRLIHGHAHLDPGSPDHLYFDEQLRSMTQRYGSLEHNTDALRSRGQTSLLDRLDRETILALLEQLNPHLQGTEIDLLAPTQNDSVDWMQLFGLADLRVGC